MKPLKQHILFDHNSQNTILLLLLHSAALVLVSLWTLEGTKLLERKEGAPQKCDTVTFCEGISVLAPLIGLACRDSGALMSGGHAQHHP